MTTIKSKRDIAGYLGVDRTTLYNWQKYRPNLYKTVMLGLKAEELIEKTEQNLAELRELRDELEIQDGRKKCKPKEADQI